MDKRSIVTTYYGPGRGKKKPVVKVTRGSNPMEVVANISRNMMNNRYGAVVAESHDEEYGELLCVATYHIGETFRVVLERDPMKPICITDFDEEGEE